jgi:PAS domain S-box-containing protein
MSDGGPPSILLVDDHEPNLLALEALLEPLKVPTVRARSGAEALERLAREDFAAVLLDVRMPGMDGFETAAIIRQTSHTREIPLIFVTASDLTNEDRQKAYANGAVDYLTKPLDPDALRAKVAALVNLWRRGESIRLREMALYEQERAALRSAMRQTEAELRLIIDGVRDHAISLLDPEGRIRTFNAPAERIKGYTLAEVQGCHFEMFFTPEDRAAALPARELAEARTHGRCELEGWRQRKDGSRFYAAVSLSAVRDADDNLVGFVKVTQDITPRRQLSEALRLSESQLRLIVDAIPGLVAYVNPDKTYRTVNRRYANWFGIAPDQAAGKAMADIIGGAAFEVVNPHLEAAIAGRAVTFEAEVPYARLGPRWVRAEYVPDIGSAGEVRGVVTLVLDVTEAKVAAARLTEEAAVNETLYRIGAALNTNLDLDSIFQRLTDEATKVCHAQFGAFFYNVDSAERGSYMLYVLSGVPREKFAGFPMPRNTDVFAPTFRGEGVVRSEDITKDPRYGRHEPYRGMPPGHLPVRSYLAVPVKSRVGTVHGGLFFGHEEPGMFKERDERVLVAIASQAAIAIDNARLLETVRRERVRAEDANRAKDLFLGSLSHELRTPLNAILGWSRLLLSGSLAEEKRERALETIDRNARAQAALIEDILDLSRITSGKMRLEVAPVEVVHVVETSLETIRPGADAKGVRLQAVLDPDAGIVHGDATRLQQICWNLLSNAVKFTPRGGRVYVKLIRTDSQVELLVSDTGRGISSGFLPRVFESFTQADSTSTREHGGLGLGLAIVKHLVELHGGTVKAESEGLDKGATFVVRLPVAPVRPAPSPADPPPAAVSGPADLDLDCAPELAGLRVLVLDDESDARDLIRTVLESCQAVVTTAATAADAFELFQAAPPDLLVSDIGMKGNDGFWLIRQIRQLPAERGGRVPAVAVTAYAAAKDRTRALLEGFTNHISKPTEPQELLAVIAASVGRAAGPRTPTT